MAATNSTDNFRNGFECVKRTDIINSSNLLKCYIEQMGGLFSAIERLGDLGGANFEIDALASIGKMITDFAHGDADELRERAEKAGVIGEFVSESKVQHA